MFLVIAGKILNCFMGFGYFMFGAFTIVGDNCEPGMLAIFSFEVEPTFLRNSCSAWFICQCFDLLVVPCLVGYCLLVRTVA